MTGLRPALMALLTWALHFFLAYTLMLVFPEARSVVWFTIGLGLACLAFLAWTLRSTPRTPVVVAATLLATVAITWQSMVGIF